MKRLLLVIFTTASLFAQESGAPSSQITIEGKVESVLYARRVEAGPWEYRQYAATVAVRQVLSKTTLKPSLILIEFQEKNDAWLPEREGQTSCSDCNIPSNK